MKHRNDFAEIIADLLIWQDRTEDTLNRLENSLSRLENLMIEMSNDTDRIISVIEEAAKKINKNYE